MKKSLFRWLMIFDALALSGLAAWWFLRPAPAAPHFDGARAYADVVAQVNFGARVPGSAASAQARDYFTTQLTAAGWTVSALPGVSMGHDFINLTAKRGNQPPEILLLAHYDSRMAADNDPNPANHKKPVPGANDGASGVAVLLELARVLPAETPVALLLVDAEDQGNLPGWDWILGSSEFAAQMSDRPRAVILLDMIGDADLTIYQERNSDPALTASLWAVAKRLGYESIFIPESKYRVIDDHLPFLEKGLPAVDLIDLDYPYWHTLADTPDKVSAASLQVVGEVLLTWILEN
ncbi:MAG: M28 family peptidase [Anaerolineales bacterium]